MSTSETAIGSWLERLASKEPTPGGGAAAAFSAATAAALVGMVTNYTTGAKWADREPRMKELNAEAERLRAEAVALADSDEVAFAAVGEAYGLPRQTSEEQEARRVAIEAALVGAAVPPARTGQLALRLVEISAELAQGSNPNVISDVAVASSSARCAIESAIVNIEVNRRLIKDEAEKQRLAEVIAHLTGGLRAADRVTAAVREQFA